MEGRPLFAPMQVRRGLLLTLSQAVMGLSLGQILSIQVSRLCSWIRIACKICCHVIYYMFLLVSTSGGVLKSGEKHILAANIIASQRQCSNQVLLVTFPWARGAH